MSVVTNSETHMLLVGPGSPSEVSLVVGNFPLTIHSSLPTLWQMRDNEH